MLVVLSLALALPAAGGELEDAPLRLDDPLVQRLLPAIARPGSGAEALVESFAALPVETLPELFAVAEAGCLRVQPPEGAVLRLELDEAIEESVVSAIARFPRALVVAHLEEVSLARPTHASREVGLRVLERGAVAEDLELLVRLAEPEEEDGDVDPAIRMAFERAVTALLARDPETTTHLRTVYLRSHLALAFSMTRALGVQESPHRLIALSELLGVRPEIDASVLSQIERNAPACSFSVPEGARQAVRTCLRTSDTMQILAASRALVALEGCDAIPDLIDLLNQGDGTVVHHARSELRRLSRCDYGDSAHDWQSWYGRERQEWRIRAGALERRVARGDPTEAAGAMLELGRTRLFRHEAARALSTGIVRREPDLVRLCCQLLGELCPREGRPALEFAVEHHAPEVRDAARQALARIEGTDGAGGASSAKPSPAEPSR